MKRINTRAVVAFMSAILISFVAYADPGTNYSLTTSDTASSWDCTGVATNTTCYHVLAPLGDGVVENSKTFEVKSKQGYAYFYADVDGDGYASLSTVTFRKLLPSGTTDAMMLTPSPADSTNPLSSADGAEPFVLTRGTWYMDIDNDGYASGGAFETDATVEIIGAD